MPIPRFDAERLEPSPRLRQVHAELEAVQTAPDFPIDTAREAMGGIRAGEPSKISAYAEAQRMRHWDQNQGHNASLYRFDFDTKDR